MTKEDRNFWIGVVAVPLLVAAISVYAVKDCDAGSIPDIAGTWTASGVTYVITQNGSEFKWSAPALQETATGRINGKSVSATWTNPFVENSGTGAITKIENGKATRIEWSNTVVFVR